MFFLMTRKCETIRSNNSTSTCTRITNPTSKIEEQHTSSQSKASQTDVIKQIPELLLDDNRISTSHSLTFQL